MGTSLYFFLHFWFYTNTVCLLTGCSEKTGLGMSSSMCFVLSHGPVPGFPKKCLSRIAAQLKGLSAFKEGSLFLFFAFSNLFSQLQWQSKQSTFCKLHLLNWCLSVTGNRDKRGDKDTHSAPPCARECHNALLDFCLHALLKWKCAPLWTGIVSSAARKKLLETESDPAFI